MNKLVEYINGVQSKVNNPGLKDITLNIKKMLDFDNAKLSKKQIISIFLSCSIVVKSVKMIELIQSEAKDILSEIEIDACFTAAYINGLKNVYYKFVNIVNNPNYAKMDIGIDMPSRDNLQIEEDDFELYALAVSAINGCSPCINFHETNLATSKVISLEQRQEAVKIASLIVAFSYFSEQ